MRSIIFFSFGSCCLVNVTAVAVARSVLTTWIELQTTVNCYMDSSKDPRGLKDTPPGLRQVRGLFSFVVSGISGVVRSATRLACR